MSSVTERLSAALADRYRIERELGQGGMATVYLAEDVRHHRKVALKVLRPELAASLGAERFLTEVRTTANLQHPNIVPLFDSGEADGFLYYVMPYVTGESLRDRLAREQRFDVATTVAIAQGVAQALAAAHEAGVVHRDVKPENILLLRDQALVADFGIARAVGQAGGERLTVTGMALGTPAYMSPEQAFGDSTVDARSDVYSLGCVIYEMLAGSPPFSGGTVQELVAKRLVGPPPALATVPPAVNDVVRRSLATSPQDRFETALALANALVQAASRPGGRATTGRRGVAIGGGAVAVLAVVGILLFGGRDGDGASSVGVADRSIAVLPLANLGGDQADDYFGIGLAEEMTRALAKAGVRVIGRSSAGALLARGLDERAIAAELGVGSLLSGSVQRAGGQVRISVTLSAADGAVRWSQAYDRPLTNVFAVQDEIAREVARELLGSIGGPGERRLVSDETADPEAHALVLQGAVLWNRRTGPAVRQAIGLLERAVARDPRYARAHGWLAVAYTTLPYYDDGDPTPYFERALAAADRALAIDSAQVEASTGAAFALMALGRLREADARFRQALDHDSTFATTWGWHSLLAARLGDFEEAHRRALRGIALEPASLITRVQVAQNLIGARQFAAADSVATRIIAGDSSFTLAWMQHAEALVGLGRAEEAVQVMTERVVARPGPRQDAIEGTHAWILARSGRLAAAREILGRVRGANGGRLPPTGDLASALAAVGDLDGGLDLLEEAVAGHDPWLALRSRTTRFDPFRDDPRGRALLARLETMQ